MRILLLARGTESYPLCHIAGRLQDRGDDIKIMNCAHPYSPSEDDISGYYKEHGIDDWAHPTGLYGGLPENIPAVDWEFLSNFESIHCINKNINQLMMTDPTIIQHHHRNKQYCIKGGSDEQRYYWTERLLKWALDEIISFGPDVAFTINRGYFIKNAAAQIILSQDLQMLTLIRSRVGDYHHIVDDYGFGMDERAGEYLTTQFSPDELEEARAVIHSFQEESKENLYSSDHQEKVMAGSLYTATDVVRSIGKSIMAALTGKTGDLGGQQGHTRFEFPNSRKTYIQHKVRARMNQLRYVGTEIFNQELPDRPFIYFPLATLPGPPTLSHSTEYFEDDLARALAKECPAAMQIAVKENPNMVGPRPFSFYHRLNDIPNVELIDPTVSSKELILHSNGVCSIGGTALLEAAMLGKVSLAFGNPEFKRILTHEGTDRLTGFIEDAADDRKPELSQAKKYIKYILDTGAEITSFKELARSNPNDFIQFVDKAYGLLECRLAA